MLRIITNLVAVVCISVVAGATYSSNWWVAAIAMALCALFIYLPIGDRKTHIFETPATDTPLWRRFLASASSMSGPLIILLAAIAWGIAFWFQIHFDVPREDRVWMFFLVWFPAFIVLCHVAALADALFRRP